MSPKRSILVTGASSGIGAACSQRLVEAGHRVVGVARRFDDGPEERGFCRAKLNLAELDALPKRTQQLLSQHPEISGVVLAAGRGHFGSLEEFSAKQIRELVDLNLTAQLIIARILLPHLKRQGQGDLVLIGSEAALSGGRRGAVYCATKFALRGMAEALRQECSKSGIRICLVNPGMVETPFFDHLPFEPGEAETEHLQASEVARAVLLAIDAPPGAVYDQINLSPLKNVLRFKRT